MQNAAAWQGGKILLAGEDLVGNEVCRGNREHTLQRDLYIKRIFFLRPFLGTPNPGPRETKPLPMLLQSFCLAHCCVDHTFLAVICPQAAVLSSSLFCLPSYAHVLAHNQTLNSSVHEAA